jgi:hypothetical protein
MIHTHSNLRRHQRRALNFDDKRAAYLRVRCMLLLCRPSVIADIPFGIPVETYPRCFRITSAALLTTEPSEIRNGNRAALEQLLREGLCESVVASYSAKSLSHIEHLMFRSLLDVIGLDPNPYKAKRERRHHPPRTNVQAQSRA